MRRVWIALGESASARSRHLAMTEPLQGLDRQHFTLLHEHTVLIATAMLRRELQRACGVDRDHTTSSSEQIELALEITGCRCWRRDCHTWRWLQITVST